MYFKLRILKLHNFNYCPSLPVVKVLCDMCKARSNTLVCVPQQKLLKVKNPDSQGQEPKPKVNYPEPKVKNQWAHNTQKSAIFSN